MGGKGSITLSFFSILSESEPEVKAKVKNTFLGEPNHKYCYRIQIRTIYRDQNTFLPRPFAPAPREGQILKTLPDLGLTPLRTQHLIPHQERKIYFWGEIL